MTTVKFFGEYYEVGQYYQDLINPEISTEFVMDCLKKDLDNISDVIKNFVYLEETKKTIINRTLPYIMVELSVLVERISEVSNPDIVDEINLISEKLNILFKD